MRGVVRISHLQYGMRFTTVHGRTFRMVKHFDVVSICFNAFCPCGAKCCTPPVRSSQVHYHSNLLRARRRCGKNKIVAVAKFVKEGCLFGMRNSISVSGTCVCEQLTRAKFFAFQESGHHHAESPKRRESIKQASEHLDLESLHLGSEAK